MLQGEKFDPQGSYVSRWVPELAGLPAHRIHRPWEATAAELADAELDLGADYPMPIIDHRMARQRALDAYGRIKKENNTVRSEFNSPELAL